ARGLMRATILVLAVSVLLACRPELDVRGTYVDIDSKAYFIPCDQPRVMWRLTDSTLALAFREAQPPRPLLVHLRGVRVDSGSVYSGTQYLRVREVLEVRPRQAAECQNMSDSLPIPLTQGLVR